MKFVVVSFPCRSGCDAIGKIGTRPCQRALGHFGKLSPAHVVERYTSKHHLEKISLAAFRLIFAHCCCCRCVCSVMRPLGWNPFLTWCIRDRTSWCFLERLARMSPIRLQKPVNIGISHNCHMPIRIQCLRVNHFQISFGSCRRRTHSMHRGWPSSGHSIGRASEQSFKMSHAIRCHTIKW